MKNTHDLDLEKFEELRDDVLGEILGGQSADIADNLKMLRVTGGVSPWVIAGLVYVGYQTFEHTYQIAQGFKKGFREGRG